MDAIHSFIHSTANEWQQYLAILIPLVNSTFVPTCCLKKSKSPQAYGKKIIRSVDLKTLSGPVMYTNLLGIGPMLFFASMGHEYSKFHDDVIAEGFALPPGTISLMLMGCIAGTGIGYSSWWCRDKVSATSFTIVGVMNKCLTIMLNYMVWDNHARPAGIACLMLCLVGGSVYKQAPMRTSQRHEKITTVGGDDIWEDDLTELGQADEEVDLLQRRTKSGE